MLFVNEGGTNNIDSHANTGPAYSQKKWGFMWLMISTPWFHEPYGDLPQRNRSITSVSPAKMRFIRLHNKEFGGVLQMIFHSIG